jgi:hypothetical protein
MGRAEREFPAYFRYLNLIIDTEHELLTDMHLPLRRGAMVFDNTCRCM